MTDGFWPPVDEINPESLFVGRGEQLSLFETAVLADRPQFMALMIFGQGGVGKTTLLGKFIENAHSRAILTPRADQQQLSVIETLVSLGTQLQDAGYPVDIFMGRHRRYRELQEQVESDPGVSRGVVNLLLSGVSQAGINELKRGPSAGGGPSEFSADELKKMSEEMGSFSAYVARKYPDKEDQALLLETETVLTAALISDLGHDDHKRRVIIFFDTYERTAPYLDSWLRDITRLKFGRLPMSVQFVIAGRLPLGREWLPLPRYIRQLELSPFTEQEAHDFLAKSGMSDEEEIRQVTRLCQGLPVLLALLAVSQGGDFHGSVFASAVDRFLEGASADQRKWALTGCVPRYFNQDVMAAILDAKSAPAAFDWLVQQAFTRQSDKGWYYHDVVRSMMNPHFQRVAVAQWTETHQRLESFYQALMSRTSGVSRESSRAEMLYHRLSRDFLGSLVEELRDFLQMGKVGVFEEPTNDPNKAYFPLQSAAVQVGAESADPEVQSWAARLKAFDAFESDAASSREFLTTLGEWEQLDLPSRVSALAILAVVEAMNDNSEAALLSANRAIRLGPEDPFAYQVRALLRISGGEPKAALPDLDRVIELMPDNRQVYSFRGQVCYSLQDYPAALESLAKAIALSPGDSNSYYWRGRVLVNLRQFPEALESFEHAVELQPDDGQNRLLAGMTHYMIGDYPGALADLNQAIRLLPEAGDGYYWRGTTNFQLQKTDDALADLTRAVELQPQDGNNFYWRARVLYTTSRYAEALADLNQAIALQPQDAENYHLRGLVYNDQQSYPQAIADFSQAIRLAPQDSKNYFWRGMVYYSLGDYPTALADFDQVLAINPNDSDAHFWRGNICYRLRDFDSALESFNHAIDLRGEDAYNHYWRALTHYDLDNPIAALADLSDAIRLKPTDDHFFYWRGRVNYNLKEYAAALDDLNQAIALRSDSGDSFYYRGRCYFQLHELERSLADMQQAIQLQPGDAQNYLWSGMIRSLLEDYPGAIGDLSQSLELDARNGDAYYWRGTAFYRLGDYPAALSDLDAAVQIDPADANNHYWRGRTNYHLKNFQAALDDLALAEQGMPGETTLPYYRGRAYYRLGNYAQALADLDQAVTLHPDDPQYYYWRAMARETLENHSGALEDLNKAIQIAPDLVVCYTARGQVYLGQGETQKALDDFERATQLDQQEPYGFLLHGMACRALGDSGRALEDLNQVAALAPNQAEGYYWRAVIQEEAGNSAAALEDLSQALRLDPQNGFYLLCRGLLGVRMAQVGESAPARPPLPPPAGGQISSELLPHEARLDLLKIKDLSGLPASAYINAAGGLVQLKEYDDACQLLRLGLQCDASLANEVAADETFDALHDLAVYQELMKEAGG